MERLEKILAWLGDNELYYRQEGKTENDLYTSQMFQETIDMLEYMDQHINTFLKDLEPIKPTFQQGKAYCGKCGCRIPTKIKARFCHKCGKEIKWHSEQHEAAANHSCR